MMKYNRLALLFLLMIFIASLSSCSLFGRKEVSRTTGWEYNNPENGGFEVSPVTEQIVGPGLILIEGGTFVMGSTQEDLMFDWNNFPRRVTISSFYMDETEVSNLDYLEYLYWLKRIFATDYPQVWVNALPDTLVWRDRLSYNEPLVETYLRHPAYHNYPVVGVNWVQANDYCSWRTDRVNEMILINQGILDPDPDQKNENNFNTEAYLAGQYEGLVNKPLRNLNPNSTGERNASIKDGLIVPRYRLPTEAEWEYACRAGSTTAYSFGDSSSQLSNYAWHEGNSQRKTHPVGKKRPNPWGLYDMYGNVWEWCQDWYGDYPSGPATDPIGPSTGSRRVLRGGSWYNSPSYCRSASRGGHTPDARRIYYGFRVVRTP